MPALPSDLARFCPLDRADVLSMGSATDTCFMSENSSCLILLVG